MSDEVLQAEMRLAGAEVGGQKREERRDALVDALVGLLGLQVSQGTLRLLAEQRALPSPRVAHACAQQGKPGDRQISYPRRESPIKALLL